METRVLTQTSQTNAIKAKRLLHRNGISAVIVRLSPKMTKNGCAFGLRVDRYAVNRAVLLLEDGGIDFGEILAY
ncbi:MAG: DUF3343 domain-containing protein [Clostridia bacterium]|nr:DUF3343 domain-containing protein [Clostridia bacterium]